LKKILKGILPWAIIIVFVVSLYYFFVASQEFEAKISYSKFNDLVEKGVVKEVHIRENEIKGELSKESHTEGDARPFKKFKTAVPVMDYYYVKHL
jgi:ATP-dependent Zn protease